MVDFVPTTRRWYDKGKPWEMQETGTPAGSFRTNTKDKTAVLCMAVFFYAAERMHFPCLISLNLTMHVLTCYNKIILNYNYREKLSKFFVFFMKFI